MNIYKTYILKPIASTWVQPVLFFGGVRVTHLFSFPCWVFLNKTFTGLHFM